MANNKSNEKKDNWFEAFLSLLIEYEFIDKNKLAQSIQQGNLQKLLTTETLQKTKEYLKYIRSCAYSTSTEEAKEALSDSKDIEKNQLTELNKDVAVKKEQDKGEEPICNEVLNKAGLQNKSSESVTDMPEEHTCSKPLTEQLGTKEEEKAGQALKPGQVPQDSSLKNVKTISHETISFSLPNAKVDCQYTEKIIVSGVSNQEIIKIVDAKCPENSGLHFNQDTQEITGTPNIAGDLKINLQWSGAQNEKRTSCLSLTVNPDPKSLWQIHEPDQSLPFPKEHLDSELIKSSDFSIVAASRRGRSHEHQGSFRDDDFFICKLPDSNWSILIVADGAGSAQYSREGSRIAVETAGKILQDKLSTDLDTFITNNLSNWTDESARKQIGDKVHYCFLDTAKQAIAAIEKQANDENQPAKSFSTTLLIALVKKEANKTFLATFWMGDGAIAAYSPNGVLKLMGMPDGGEFAGQTRFLDRNALQDPDFNNRISIGYWDDIQSVILMTDGVSDPFFETDNELKNIEKWNDLWKAVSAPLDDSEPDKKLLDWLSFFKPGHHDDRTIAVLW